MPRYDRPGPGVPTATAERPRRAEPRRRVDRAGRLLTPDEVAVLFLCCAAHTLPCPLCGAIVEIGRLLRDADHRRYCPDCRANVTDAVVAHMGACCYFRERRAPIVS